MMVGKTNIIHCLEPGQVYKYLGVDESNGIQHSMMRERVRHAYCRRVKVVLWTELYGRNKILAINGFALPVLTYGFGIIQRVHGPAAARLTDQTAPLYARLSTILLQTLTNCTLLAVMG